MLHDDALSACMQDCDARRDDFGIAGMRVLWVVKACLLASELAARIAWSASPVNAMHGRMSLLSWI